MTARKRVQPTKTAASRRKPKRTVVVKKPSATRLKRFTEAVSTWVQANNAEKQAKLLKDAVRKDIEDFLVNDVPPDNEGKVTIDITDDFGTPRKITYVQGETLELDEQGIMADLTDDEWASICKMTFSMELFEEAILNGTIDKKVLQKNSKMKPKTAFPKIT